MFAIVSVEQPSVAMAAWKLARAGDDYAIPASRGVLD